MKRGPADGVDVPIELVKRLERYRQEAHITRAALAKALGVSPGHMCRILNLENRTRPRCRRLLLDRMTLLASKVGPEPEEG